MNKYDIIVYGATGFTGKRSVAYFKKQAPKTIKWAIAGRNEQKLLALKKELDLNVDIILCDALHEVDVDMMVQQTKVVLTTAGPFALYGSHLVAACAKHGVHYVDITGEAPWVRDMLDAHGATAKQSGAKIIPFCGFDSIPADLGIWLLQKYMREQFQTEFTKADAYYTLAKGGLNGGTLLSALNMLEQGEAKRLGNPKLLTKDLAFRDFIPKIKRSFKKHYSEDLKRWAYPFFMADINTKVVYRSVALAAEHGLQHPKELLYQEYHAVGKSSQATMASMGLASFAVLGQAKFVRSIVKKFGPKTGEGPKEADIEEGFFKLRIIGEDEKGNRAMMTMQYPGDAGNKATVCFLCESAFALVSDLDRLPQVSGFLTPTAAFQGVLFERLLAADLQMSCETLEMKTK